MENTLTVTQSVPITVKPKRFPVRKVPLLLRKLRTKGVQRRAPEGSGLRVERLFCVDIVPFLFEGTMDGLKPAKANEEETFPFETEWIDRLPEPIISNREFRLNMFMESILYYLTTGHEPSLVTMFYDKDYDKLLAQEGVPERYSARSLACIQRCRAHILEMDALGRRFSPGLLFSEIIQQHGARVIQVHPRWAPYYLVDCYSKNKANAWLDFLDRDCPRPEPELFAWERYDEEHDYPPWPYERYRDEPPHYGDERDPY